MIPRLLIACLTLTVVGMTAACASAPAVSTLESADQDRAGADAPDPAPSSLEIPAELIAQAEELGQPDAAWYAVEHGVSVEEAVARLEAQATVGPAEARIASALGAPFAGLWIEHEPEFRVVIASTDPTPPGNAAELTAGIDAPVAWETAEFSLGDLEAVRAVVDPAVRRLDGVDGTYTDVRRNALVIDLLDADPVERALEGLDLPEGAVLLVEVAGLSTLEDGAGE
jgi:hypothetical protein